MQSPQRDTSVCRFVQVSPHKSGEAPPQPAEHIAVAPVTAQTGVTPEQDAPHAPQAAPLVSAVSQSEDLESQLAKPALQTGLLHAPSVHEETPLSGEQALWHAPQCWALERNGVSHPSSALQSPNPSLHFATTQIPSTHVTSSTLGSVRQSLPQAPQWATLLFKSAHVLPHLSGAVPPQFAAHTNCPVALGAQNGISAGQG